MIIASDKKGVNLNSKMCLNDPENIRVETSDTTKSLLSRRNIRQNAYV